MLNFYRLTQSWSLNIFENVLYRENECKCINQYFFVKILSWIEEIVESFSWTIGTKRGCYNPNVGAADKIP